MRYLLNVVYLALLCAYLPVILFQRVVNGKRRPGLWSKVVGSGPVRQGDKHCILFHAVSLGEVNAIKRLVKEFQLSTTTQTGLDAAEKSFAEINVCLLPFDFTWATKRFLANLKPDIVVLAELEIWPNLLRECRTRSIPTCLVNARLNEKSHAKYQRLIRWMGNVFGQLNRVCCQNEEYARRFESLGVPESNTVVTGNLKYDSLLVDRENAVIQSFRKLVRIGDDELVLIAGSTQAPEEQLVIDAFKKLEVQFPQLRLLICPRHPERFDEVAGLLEHEKVRFCRRSQMVETTESESSAVERVVLLDCMGELGNWWGVGHIAFVGGSFGNRGGQNMIEPLGLSNAVCFGPNTRNFAQEVGGLVAYDAAVQLQEPSDLLAFIKNCVNDKEYRDRLANNGRRYLNDHSNCDQPAWLITLKNIEMLMNEQPSEIEKRRDQRAA